MTTNPNLPPVKSQPASTHFADERERRLFHETLGSFLPPVIFDVHAHLYCAGRSMKLPEHHGSVTIAQWHDLARDWMGDLAPKDGLFFGFPTSGQDTSQDNALVLAQLAGRSASRGLMLVRPNDDPAMIEQAVREQGWAGFKVYHVYAERADTFNASINEYLTQWMWELADRYGLAIMLHMVKPKGLADLDNQRVIRERCLAYPNVKLILAHAARGFCADNTIDGLDALRGLHNVFFDTSAICESPAIIAILQRFGTSRLMYGSDFPVSQLRGGNVSLGDGFYWLYDNNAQFNNWQHGQPVLVGIQSLLALRQAARLCHLRDDDLECIFDSNARRLLGLNEPPDGSKTQQLYDHARSVIPGGTQLLSKRPEMHAPGAWPAYFREAHGIEVIDLDGRRFLDFSMTGIGSTLLGFADPDVNAAVSRQVMLGSMSTLNPPDEVALVDALIELHPWSQQARLTRSGGESMAMAVRMARAATGRSRVAICGYHGWHDWYLAANLAGNADVLGGHLLPGLEPAGVPNELAGTTLAFAYNKPEQLEAIVAEHGHDLAAIVMEPMRFNPPLPGFIQTVRALADRCGAALIFDEITTGWRFRPGGLHLDFDIQPDVAVFSKAMGNGFPIGAVIGKTKIMDAAQRSFISSTMWTEAVGPAAALATMQKLASNRVHEHVRTIGEHFQTIMRDAAARHDVAMHVDGPPALTHVHFDDDTDLAVLTLYTRLMLEEGFLAGGSFYPCFAHEQHHVEAIGRAANRVLAKIANAIQTGQVMRLINDSPRHRGFVRLT